MNLLLIFLTGLTTGGLSCLAMQGGLLASVIANQKEEEHNNFNQNKKKKTTGFLGTCSNGLATSLDVSFY